jgi:hypothetical protein
MGKEGAFMIAQAAIVVVVLLLISLPISNQTITTIVGSQSSTSTEGNFIDTTTSVSTPTVLTTNAASSFSGNCSNPVPADPLPNLGNESESSLSHMLFNGSVRSVVFVMKPGAVATVCIGYALNRGNYSASDFDA